MHNSPRRFPQLNSAMFLNDEPKPPAESEAAIPELLEAYKARRARLFAQTRELERLREQVRGSAEREAAAIVAAARRDVRQVLLEARRELLVLVAQLQAVGCDTQAGDVARNVVPGEATATTVRAAVTGDPFDSTREMVTGARRDVREVLVEAQSELIALSEEAKELRARIARRRDGPGDEARRDSAAPPEPAALQPEPPAPVVESGEQVGPPSQYATLSSPPRVWMAIAAAVAFAAVATAVFLFSGDPQRGAAVVSQRQPAGGAQAAAAPALSPTAAPVASAPAGAPDRSGVLLAIDVRRPAWIRTTIDGRADIGRLFKAGEKRTIAADREVVMRAGDAGAVFVSVDGAEARALGLDGRVVTRRFGTRRPALQTAAAEVPARDPEPVRSPVPTVAELPRATIDRVPAPAPAAQRTDVGTSGAAEPAPAPAPAERLVLPEAASSGAEREILRATQRWFEAFFGGDRAGMAEVATDDFSLSDQRAGPPTTMTDVDRSMQQVRIEVAGDGAVLSARLTEKLTVDGQERQYVSLVSGVWIRRDGRWRLMAVRFVDPANVGHIVR